MREDGNKGGRRGRGGGKGEGEPQGITGVGNEYGKVELDCTASPEIFHAILHCNDAMH